MSYNVKSRGSTRRSLVALTWGAAAFLLFLAGFLGISQPSSAADGEFVNLSTRGWVGTGNDVGIVGFIIEDGSRQVLIQALGPELVNRGISNALADPVLTVTNTTDPANPMELMVNDNWEDSQGQLVTDLWGGSPPLSAGSLSSAVVLTLDPGNYTAKVEGKNGTVGVASVEVYRIGSAGESNPDHEALTALYNSTGGANWGNRSNWLTDVPLDQWDGVTVDDNGRVIELGLSENQLSGPIPAEIGNLTYLETLNLRLNQLSGRIPVELGNLANLVELNLRTNQLNGPIPAELGNLGNLVGLWLYENELSGLIPVELGNLANLESLGLYDNRLSGPIPRELGNLANLQYLWLHDNQLSGLIPPELGNLANLERLSLSGNLLNGQIPTDLGSLGNLTGLWLSENELSGPVPVEFGNLANLETFALYDNR